ncbi:tartrate-resistant acid phosphatase type 5-like [Actinia tenebrosa]|uniref:Tartrate-resistant acid phosphatase type 5 n=1 Tax=Actinia tenebrosa TaxID=6105 RepID=A0A6P8HBZ7_ACTTE|nr:tartrate-resistant acid phosphatase type 5-like [Actinia tenebrosa]
MSTIKSTMFFWFWGFIALVHGFSTSVKRDQLNFIVLGDWGGLNFFPYKTPIESAVAKQMSKTSEQLGAQFIVALGDNFYFSGVKNVNDKRFEETFENVFSSKSLQIPWYFCAGNHDHYGNASAQIAYSQKSNRWNFPYYYYTKDWTIPGTDKKLQLVMIDTVLLCGNTVHDFLGGNNAQGPDSIDDAEVQWSWLEKTLKSSQAQYLLVGGHFPVWSIAEHGPTQCLVERLKPLLEKYDVTAYLSGHDHNLQHIKDPKSSVDYFVSGSGAYVANKTDHKDDIPALSLQFYWANPYSYGGFATIQASPSSMLLTFIDAEGRQLYTRALHSREYKHNIH